MFSKSCQYAIQAMIYIALNTKNKKKISLKEIANSQKIPLHFLSKILQILVKNKLLLSMKGPTGGFSLSKSASKITLNAIVKAIDGLDILDKCGIGFKKCSDDNPCPIHYDYKIVKEKIKVILKEKSLEELCFEIKEGKSFVTYYE